MRRHQPRPPPARRDWAYFLDVDGTLLELAATPDAVRVDPALPLLLHTLQQACNGAVALVSGRKLVDLDLRLGMFALPCAGQHGLERRDADGRLWLRPYRVPGGRQLLLDSLAPLLQRHSDLLLEDKGMSLALHYRQRPKLAPYLYRFMRSLLARVDGDLELQAGKCVIEIKPGGVDKGTVIAEYLAEPPFLGRRPVFIGDDHNDEHGFAMVNAHDGISIGVGYVAEGADYRLPNVAAVHGWLAGAIGGGW